MRGISLPVNLVVIIILAILVLMVIAFIFTANINPFVPTYENALNRGCEIYMETGHNPSTITVEDINRDNKEDTLLDVCRIYYSNDDMSDSDCANICKKRFPGG